MKNLTLEVTGMGCEGCAAAVKGALESVEGARRVLVSLEEGRARVLADDVVAGRELVAAVEAAGYEACLRS